jgi:hypothetical protein
MKMVPKVKKAITIILHVVETCDVFRMAHIPCSVLFQNSDVPDTPCYILHKHSTSHFSVEDLQKLMMVFIWVAAPCTGSTS